MNRVFFAIGENGVLHKIQQVCREFDAAHSGRDTGVSVTPLKMFNIGMANVWFSAVICTLDGDDAEAHLLVHIVPAIAFPAALRMEDLAPIFAAALFLAVTFI
ncbi:MAG: hypothetical protein LBB38_03115 [Puniceicoccales bacterium]|jgi:hypothetical protein|nr:hypothetical protein [Puniceicoccales bacterium]